jgi:SulP family sulfate permease
MAKQLQQYIPALNWLRNYQSKHLFGDITAGIIVTSLLIPQGMAYLLVLFPAADLSRRNYHYRRL